MGLKAYQSPLLLTEYLDAKLYQWEYFGIPRVDMMRMVQGIHFQAIKIKHYISYYVQHYTGVPY